MIIFTPYRIEKLMRVLAWPPRPELLCSVCHEQRRDTS